MSTGPSEKTQREVANDVTNYDSTAERAAREADERLTCVWAQEDAWDMSDSWQTQCGSLFVFSSEEGAPCEDGINFCCYCGRPIERHDAPDEEDDDDD